MKQGHAYEFVQCQKCGKWVVEHWLVRHRKSGCKKGGHDKPPQVEHVCHQRGAADLRRENERLLTALEQIYAVSREYAMYDVFRGFDKMQAIAKAALGANNVQDQP